MTEVLPDEITLPKSATMPSLLKLEEELAQAAGIDAHQYISLKIDRFSDILSFASSPREYGIQSVKIWASPPFSYKRKTMWARRPKHGEFVVSIASLKKKIEKLEEWCQSQIELLEQNDKEIQNREELVKQCNADGLPMYTGSSHWFEATNGCETLSVSVARRFTIAEAIALNDFLKKLFEQENS